MGFFSSRWSEKNDKSASGTTTVIKSKWYGTKSRAREPEERPSSPVNSPSKSRTRDASHSPASPPRPSTDPVTMTLAQRLNELATANADGLLDDEEYRLLRQNLFERFGAASQLPSEPPHVRLPGPSKNGHHREPSGTSKLDSNFHVSRGTAASVRSSTSHGSSVGTAVTSLFRRATGRNTAPSILTSDRNDAMSIHSRTSSTFQRNPPPPRTLVHQSSNGSLSTHNSRTPYDMRSISSRRTGRSAVTFGDDGLSRMTSRSTRGPPSAYHVRTYTEGSDGAEKTAAELRAEILSVEAEGKRLADAFAGLELSALTKHQPGPMSAKAISGKLSEVAESTWTLIPEQGASTLGRASSRSGRAPITQPVRLHRKGSLTSSLRPPMSPPPPVPPLPSSHSLAAPSRHLALSSPHLPLATSSHPTIEEEEDPDLAALQKEMDDIRRRKAEVIQRYEARLEYLRAKLKTAEIHERLLK